MPLENTARGRSSVMISDSGSLMAGRSQMKYGLWIVERPAAGLYRDPHRNHDGDDPDANRADYRLFFWLWPRDRALLSCARMERDCHDANAEGRRSTAVGTSSRARTGCDQTRKHC